MTMTRFPYMLERFYQPLYDTVTITPDTSTAEFFTLPIESDGKTVTETNMAAAGQLPYPTNFEIHGFSVKSEYTANPEQVKKFADGASFRFFIGTKDYLVVPLNLVLDLSESSLENLKLSDDETNLDVELVNLLLKKRTNQPMFQLPKDAIIDLIPLLNFKATIYSLPNRITENFKLTTVLYGYYKRALH